MSELPFWLTVILAFIIGTSPVWGGFLLICLVGAIIMAIKEHFEEKKKNEQIENEQLSEEEKLLSKKKRLIYDARLLGLDEELLNTINLDEVTLDQFYPLLDAQALGLDACKMVEYITIHKFDAKAMEELLDLYILGFDEETFKEKTGTNLYDYHDSLDLRHMKYCLKAGMDRFDYDSDAFLHGVDYETYTYVQKTYSHYDEDTRKMILYAIKEEIDVDKFAWKQNENLPNLGYDIMSRMKLALLTEEGTKIVDMVNEYVKKECAENISGFDTSWLHLSNAADFQRDVLDYMRQAAECGIDMTDMFARSSVLVDPQPNEAAFDPYNFTSGDKKVRAEMIRGEFIKRKNKLHRIKKDENKIDLSDYKINDVNKKFVLIEE